MSGFLIACGGTGGHLSPGIALAQCINARGHRSQLLISQKDVDSKLVAAYPELDFVRSPGAAFSWKPFRFLKFNWQQCRAFQCALNLLNKFKPDVVVAFGGFLSVGVVIAAFMKGIPVVLHEANRKPGRAIRMLSGMSRRIYLPEGVKIRDLPPETLRHAGYPVRTEIKAIPRDQARRKLNVDVPGKLLLVLGGSQGALPLIRWVKEQFKKLAEEGISVLCVTGLIKDSRENLEHESKDGQIAKAIFMPFTNQMTEVLSCADLVVTRAGAGSIAECTRCRLPSILVPYPYATDDHQTENARFLEQQGGGIVIPQHELDRLVDEVVETIYNDWLLGKIKTNLEQLDRNNSADWIVDDLESLIEMHRKEAA